MAVTEAPLSYQAIRSANQAREADEMKTESRKKNILILMLQYLSEEGYCESANTLSKETNLDMSKYEVCDNIDLPTILMEYESYFYVKFSRYPKITKKLSANSNASERKLSRTNSKNNGVIQKRSALPNIPTTNQQPNLSNSASSTSRSSVKSCQGIRPKKEGNVLIKNNSETSICDLSLHGTVLHGNQGADVPTPSLCEQSSTNNNAKNKKIGQIIDIRSMINDVTKLNAEEGSADERLLKPLGGYMAYNQEWRDLAQVISRDIYSENPNVKWDDIIGLDEAKRLVKESVVYPIKYPQLFTGILSPWKGLLLYGPPGTGKTLLAKAVATECSTTFFNISASTVVSKWRGDSEKLVRVLFEMARFYAPSTIFLDELESLMSQRGSQGGGSEHEGSRRLKTELLVQMDGLAKTDDLVFLLAASNLPWELDHAMLRRLEKRILVDIPTWEARKAMFHSYLPTVIGGLDRGLRLHTKLDYDILAARTEGYSGSDLKLVCKESAMKPVRKIFDALENHNEGNELHVKLDTLLTQDVIAAIDRTKPSVSHIKDRYIAWQREYGSV